MPSSGPVGLGFNLASILVRAPPNSETDSGTVVQQAGALADVAAAAQQVRYDRFDVPFEVRSRRDLANLLDPLEAKDIMDSRSNTVFARGLGQAEPFDSNLSGRVKGTAFVDQSGKVGKAAKATGLVVSRPDHLTRRNFVRGRGGDVSRTLRRRGSLGSMSTELRNLKVAKVVQNAAKDGQFGEEAMDAIARNNPDSIAKQVALPEKGLPPGELKPKAPRVGKLAKTADKFVRAAPIIGTAFDAANVYDEFTDPDSTMLEKAASVGDLALGLTGAPLVLDLWAGVNNHDGFFAMLVGDKD